MPKLFVQWCKKPADEVAFRFCLASADAEADWPSPTHAQIPDDRDRRSVVASCGVAQLLVAPGPSVPSQLRGCRHLVVVGRNPCWPLSLLLHGAIQKCHPLRWQPGPLSSRRPQRTAGAVASRPRCDAAVADASTE